MSSWEPRLTLHASRGVLSDLLSHGTEDSKRGLIFAFGNFPLRRACLGTVSRHLRGDDPFQRLMPFGIPRLVFSFGWHVTKALGLAKAEDVSISLWSHNAI